MAHRHDGSAGLARDCVLHAGQCNRKIVLRCSALASALALSLAAGLALAQATPAAGSATPAAEPPEHPGRQVLASKCTQCHGDSMWRDIRQDETAWRATIYRMVGKGAVWSEPEIRAMSGYLASVMGPSMPAAPATK